MKKRLLSMFLTLCTLICLVPTGVFAGGETTEIVAAKQELVDALADDTALRSVAVQSIGPNEAEVANDLYEKISAQVSVIKLISDIELGICLPIDYEVTIDLNGHVLKMADDASGSVIVVGDKGDLTIIDSNPTAEHKFKVNGTDPWVLDETGGTVTVEGGVIYCGMGSISGSYVFGGGVYVEGGTFTMKGGNIVGCTASGTFHARGGGVYVAEKGTFSMTGGSIAGCTAVGGYSHGGGVCNEGTMTLSGTAEIRDCHAKDSDGDTAYGGGISDIGGVSQISGDVRITGCTASGGRLDAVSMSYRSSISGGTFDGSMGNEGTISGGIFNGKVVNSGTITDGTFNGDVVNEPNGTISGGAFNGTVTNYGTITEGAISGVTVTYRVNDADYATQVLQQGDQITLPVPAKLGCAFDGWYKDGTKWDAATPVTESLTLTGWLYSPVTSESELTAALNDTSVDVIRLTSDIKLSNELQITNNRRVILDLNGYVLDLGGKHISVSAFSGDPWYHSNQLTIIDSDPTNPHKVTDNDGLWKLDENGDKTVKGGIITGGSSAITVGLRGKVTMNGGSIVGCSSGNCGGGVFIDGGVFEFNDGAAIIGCTATSVEGGGVFMEKGTFTMSGGNIQDCRAYSSSGVYVESGLFELKSGSIQNCLSRDGFAVVYVYMDGTFTMTGGEITGSTSNYGVYLNGATMNANGGTVDGTVVLDVNSGGSIQGGGTTFSGLIINNNPQARFSGAHSPLGIVGEEPIGANGHTYHKVTFDPAGGNMDYLERYFFYDGNISDQIVPDFRAGYFFAGWYNGENKWNHSDTVGEDDLTLTAHWTACDHSGHTGAQPTCTDTAICTVCSGTIPALDHDWGEWTSNNNNTHTRICKRDNTHTQTKDCSGGEAACREKAVCADCGKAYGDLDPANHKDGSQEWTKTETAHEKKWSCCGAVTVASEAHEWADGVCSECGYVCLHDDTDKNHICDICEKVISNHEDADKDHICDYCEKIITNHEDADKDHICDYCEKVISNHEDANKDHICDYCEKVISNHEDANKDHVCDFCEKIISNHIGGTAACTEKAVCEVCGKSYGELDPNNHTGLEHIPAKAATENSEGNTEYWHCEDCGKYYADAEATKEITDADTVTKKLPPKTADTTPVKDASDTKAPGTGDGCVLMICIALMTVSTGAIIALLPKRKKSS